MFQRLTLALLFAFAPFITFAGESTPDWPQWRGPNRDGTVAGPAWPDKLAGRLEKVWRVDGLGPSYSTPVVSGDRVFVTETVDKKAETVRCLERSTGKEHWKKEWEGALTVPFFAARNGSWIRATPACDGESVYVAGIRDVLVCFDVKDGSERWRFDFVKEFKSPPPAFGFVSSPLLDDKGVYVQAGAAAVKLDKRTGKLLWKSLEDAGGMMGSAFSSPTSGTVAGKKQLLVQTRLKLAGLDQDSGEVLWSRPIPADRGMNILTPTQVGDAVFTSSYGGGTRLVKVAKAGDKLQADDGWAIKYQGYMTSPVVIDGHAYFFGRDRRFICVDLKDGTETWRSEKRFGEYCSLVAQGRKILALDMNGKLYLLNANPKEFDPIDEAEVAKAETWAHLAVCGDELYVRDLEGVTAFRWK